MRICIDLDGVICQLRRPGQEYADLEPVPGAIEKLRALRAAGHYIIIATARHMKTCDGNVGKVDRATGSDNARLARPARRRIRRNPLRQAARRHLHRRQRHAIRSLGAIAADGSTLPRSREKAHAAANPGSGRQTAMNIVMPMAGRGHRFVEVGIDVPKPLIDVRGRPMYAWATDGLPLDEAAPLDLRLPGRASGRRGRWKPTSARATPATGP